MGRVVGPYLLTITGTETQLELLQPLLNTISDGEL